MNRKEQASRYHKTVAFRPLHLKAVYALCFTHAVELWLCRVGESSRSTMKGVPTTIAASPHRKHRIDILLVKRLAMVPM